VGATAHLTVAEGDDGLAVAVVEPSWTDMHVAYREGSRHPLAKGAAGRAILALRDGSDEYLVTEGQLQEGARGIAAPVTGLPWLEASVGVVTFGPLEESAGPRVVSAAAELAAALG
jgi:DNA-binding IclR family transcriptional regulator